MVRELEIDRCAEAVERATLLDQLPDSWPDLLEHQVQIPAYARPLCHGVTFDPSIFDHVQHPHTAGVLSFEFAGRVEIRESHVSHFMIEIAHHHPFQ